jgi:SAM-dependent methyltransferase
VLMALQVAAPYNPWIQRVCPSPRRYFQYLVLRSGCRNGVDFGCGENSLLTPLRRHGLYCVGVDLSPAMLEKARNANLFDQYVCEDAVAWQRNTVRQGQSPEVIVASHLIEHLDRATGEEFLGLVERGRPRLVYIETPYGFVEPGFEGDVFSRHKSGWFPWDFAARGYTVFGMGLRGLRGSRGRPRFGREPLTRTVERACQWLSYRFPSLGSTLAAIRYVDEAGNLRRL